MLLVTVGKNGIIIEIALYGNSRIDSVEDTVLLKSLDLLVWGTAVELLYVEKHLGAEPFPFSI